MTETTMLFTPLAVRCHLALYSNKLAYNHVDDFKPMSVDHSKPARMRVSEDEVIVSVPNVQVCNLTVLRPTSLKNNTLACEISLIMLQCNIGYAQTCVSKIKVCF